MSEMTIWDIIPCEDRYDDYLQMQYIKYTKCVCGAKRGERCRLIGDAVHKDRAIKYSRIIQEYNDDETLFCSKCGSNINIGKCKV